MSGSPIVTNAALQIEYLDDYTRITNVGLLAEYSTQAISTVGLMIEYETINSGSATNVIGMVEYAMPDNHQWFTTLLGMVEYREEDYTRTTTTTNDSYLNSGSPTDIYGTNEEIILSAGATPKKGLLRFEMDASVVPSDQKVLSAKLRIVPNGTYESDTYTVYSVSDANADWVEGDASWDYKETSGSTAWAGTEGLSTPTTDYDPELLGSVTTATVEGQAVEIEFNAKGKGVIKNKWIEDGVNGGIIFVNENATENRSFKSKNSSPINAPTIEILYGTSGNAQRKLLLGVG
jgi:hypothetical protein